MIIRDIFHFSLKPYIVIPYLNRLVETFQMRGSSRQDVSDEASQHMFYAELIKKSIPNYHQIRPHI